MKNDSRWQTGIMNHARPGKALIILISRDLAKNEYYLLPKTWLLLSINLMTNYLFKHFPQEKKQQKQHILNTFTTMTISFFLENIIWFSKTYTIINSCYRHIHISFFNNDKDFKKKKLRKSHLDLHNMRSDGLQKAQWLVLVVVRGPYEDLDSYHWWWCPYTEGLTMFTGPHIHLAYSVT